MKDFSYLIGANFTDPKMGQCTWTNQSSSQGPLGMQLSLTSTKRIENVTFGSNSNMGSIVKAMKDALEATGYSELHDYQRKTIEAYLSGKDVFVSAPTGAGKSLTFELAPYTFDHLFGEACNAIVFVIVPLISLMKDQVSNLNSRGIRASYVGDDCSEEQLGTALQKNNEVRKKILPFVTTYHPALPNLKNILMSKWHLIQDQPLLREIYNKPPIISYKRAKSLADNLIRAKL